MAAQLQPADCGAALARRLAVQALYRWQLNPSTWQDLASEFSLDADMARADGEYFRALVQQVIEQHEQLDLAMAPFLDRAAARLDPLEHAVLLVASVELQHRPQLHSAWSSTRRSASRAASAPRTAHKFINGVLDRAARAWRPAER